MVDINYFVGIFSIYKCSSFGNICFVHSFEENWMIFVFTETQFTFLQTKTASL